MRFLFQSLPLGWNLAPVAISGSMRSKSDFPLVSHRHLAVVTLPSNPLELMYFHTKQTLLLLVSFFSSPRTRLRVPMDDLETGPGGTNGTQDGGKEQRQRDAQFWYEDGTVILVVHDVEFRVYKGVLVQHSLFFRDMFSLP